MGLLKLRLSMVGTLAAIIGLSTLFFTVILSLIGMFDLITLSVFVILFNIVQWLVAPYLIDALYHIKEVPRKENLQLYERIEKMSEKTGIKTPRIMLASIPIPNAFAYGSPIAGTRIAVTDGLTKALNQDQVDAVIGHELGHLRHKDVQVMMFVSILPAIFYFIGYSFMLSSMFGRRDDRNGGGAVLIGIASMVLYWILTMFTLYLSRLREYYADRNSAMVVENGASKLSEALGRIQYSTGRMKKAHPQVGNFQSLRALFISDPNQAESDAGIIFQIGSFRTDKALVEELLKKQVTTADKLFEVFSTHPNIIKRLKALKELE